MLKYFFNYSKQISFVLLTAILFIFLISNSYSKKNNFYVENIEISKKIDLNFNKDKVIVEIFRLSFDKLLTKVIFSKDLKKIKKVKINEIKKLVDSFQIFDEKYNNLTYSSKANVYFNPKKISNFFGEKGIVFANPKKITLVFFPILYDNNKIKLFNENVFFREWNKDPKQSKLIDFIVPIEDIEELNEIINSKFKPENINILKIAQKYNTENYVIAIMEIKDKKLNIFLKMNMDNEKHNVNLPVIFNTMKDQKAISETIKVMKTAILDSWKQSNKVNYSLPLSVNIHFKNKNLNELNNFENTLNEMEIIYKFSIKEFSFSETVYKVEYFGDPKKLNNEFSKLNYKLSQEQGLWQIKNNE